MSEHARRALALLVAAAVVGVGWRAVAPAPAAGGAPPPCTRPVDVAGDVRTPGVVCLDPGDGAAVALRLAGADCRGAPDLGEPAAGDRLTVTRAPVGCRLTRDRLPPLALRTLRVRIDPNRADEAELRALPGIGPALARRVVDSRRRDGPFRSVDELRRVRGIGPRTLERLRDRLVVQP